MNIFFNLQVDCESTQHSIKNPALGERALRGLQQILAQTGMKATFVAIPGDIEAHAAIYRELAAEGHEIGVHLHPADMGYDEFLGVYGLEDHSIMLRKAADIFAQAFGRRPECFTPGYFSANDFTFPALENAGFRHGLVSMPTRNLPQCACVWGSSPLTLHYPHRFNRCLTGNVDFVDVPMTVDVESRMWGGAHPQDLRVELVDAKNHWYTIRKNVVRQAQAADAIPVKHLKALTHNFFDYSDERDFRRETLLGVIAAVGRICDEQQCALVPATTATMAEAFRQRVPLPRDGVKLTLDARGR